MHSRAVLLLSLFGLACLVVVGSLSLHLTSASASEESAAAEHSPEPAAHRSSADTGTVSPNLSVFRDPADGDVTDAGSGNAVLSPLERATVEKLETLLRQVHVMFEPEGEGVSNAMIPYLAEMITLINQYEHLIYRIEIVEPDAALARRRAQTLNDVLRLNVLDPSNLRIVGREGMHAALVDVSAL